MGSLYRYRKNSTGLDVSFQKGRGGTPYRTDAIGEIIPQEPDIVNTDEATSIAPHVEKDAEISIAPPVDEEGVSEEGLDIKDRNRAKLTHYKEELKSNIDHRKESWSSYNEQISSLEKEYAGKKNKDSKAANTLAKRIDVFL